jgi:hypothetical protein
MKIAIFGDSFASYHSKENTTLSWPQVLGFKYRVNNYAESASSLYFAISKFLEHHAEYDKVIFFITSPGRLTLPESSNFVDSHGNAIRHVTFESANRVSTAQKTGWAYPEHTSKMFDAAAEYFKYIQNDNYDEYTHALMINHIKLVRPDALFVDCFKSLFEITKLENAHYKITNDTMSKYVDVRNCHLTKKNNEMLAGAIESWIDTGYFTYSTNDYVVPIEPFSTYFKKQE